MKRAIDQLYIEIYSKARELFSSRLPVLQHSCSHVLQYRSDNYDALLAPDHRNKGVPILDAFQIRCFNCDKFLNVTADTAVPTLEQLKG